MPHAELKYSADLALDAGAVLRGVEAVIARHDAGAGVCKGRAYPAAVFHHTHCLLTVSVLPKAHRDKAWSDALLALLEAELTAHLPVRCYVSIAVEFTDERYVTTEYAP